ncbi:uncharacterized protein J3D65DRAFT_694484 [Phyllosticta citribraziliensis]|uniref:Uncharacterized protein n=1 Tax=Phyllosticta citribraziliensis TaxID=989973 RepID=A0ABR1LSW5_9PEZI
MVPFHSSAIYQAARLYARVPHRQNRPTVFDFFISAFLLRPQPTSRLAPTSTASYNWFSCQSRAPSSSVSKVPYARLQLFHRLTGTSPKKDAGASREDGGTFEAGGELQAGGILQAGCDLRAGVITKAGGDPQTKPATPAAPSTPKKKQPATPTAGSVSSPSKASPILAAFSKNPKGVTVIEHSNLYSSAPLLAGYLNLDNTKEARLLIQADMPGPPSSLKSLGDTERLALIVEEFRGYKDNSRVIGTRVKQLHDDDELDVNIASALFPVANFPLKKDLHMKDAELKAFFKNDSIVDHINFLFASWRLKDVIPASCLSGPATEKENPRKVGGLHTEDFFRLTQLLRFALRHRQEGRISAGGPLREVAAIRPQFFSDEDVNKAKLVEKTGGEDPFQAFEPASDEDESSDDDEEQYSDAKEVENAQRVLIKSIHESFARLPHRPSIHSHHREKILLPIFQSTQKRFGGAQGVLIKSIHESYAKLPHRPSIPPHHREKILLSIFQSMQKVLIKSIHESFTKLPHRPSIPPHHGEKILLSIFQSTQKGKHVVYPQMQKPSLPLDHLLNGKTAQPMDTAQPDIDLTAKEIMDQGCEGNRDFFALQAMLNKSSAKARSFQAACDPFGFTKDDPETWMVEGSSRQLKAHQISTDELISLLPRQSTQSTSSEVRRNLAILATNAITSASTTPKIKPEAGAPPPPTRPTTDHDEEGPAPKKPKVVIDLTLAEDDDDDDG